MFQALVIMLREGVEAALIIGIILAYLRKIERSDLTRSVYLGLSLAVLASLIGAWSLSRIQFNAELFEGVAMLVAAVFVSSMIIWMWRTAHRLKGEIEQRVGTIVEGAAAGYSWGLVGFTFVMIFREGIETILFLSAVNLTTDALLSWLGGIIGLGLAVTLGIAIFKGAVRIDLGRFFKVTGIVLLVFAVQLVIGGLHELAEAGVIPLGPRQMSLIGPLVKHDVLFILTIIALPLIMTLVPSQQARQRLSMAAELHGAEARKQLAQLNREKRWRLITATVGVLIVTVLTVNYAYSTRSRTISPPKLVQADNGLIKIPIAEVNDGQLHRFGLPVNGTTVRFLALKTDEGKIRTAFDACEICGAYGYVQEDRAIVCLNCAADIHAPTIGETGGCNPIPLASHVNGDWLVVAASDVMKEVGRFGNSEPVELLDPVCQMKLRMADVGKQVQHNGRTYYFCKMPECAKAFEKNPEMYAR
ncbi:MAG: Fe-S-containing protein [Acidobacteriota bacterium]|nr:Fe-S-containing protein [Blastocatellia bacterium]MDW8238396.1 Fe-S-containing protein [Acidobacteriota bacterium]